MIEVEKEALIRAYAKGDVSWQSLQSHGFDNYFELLASLGELGLRPPIADMTGQNVEGRKRGIAILRDHIRKGSRV
jgi:hypothetical protein